MTRTKLKQITRISFLARNPWLWLLTLLIWTVAGPAQQDSMKACNLLSAAELRAAVGGNVGHPSGIFLAKNPRLARNGDSWSCEQMVGTRKVWILYNTLQATGEQEKQEQVVQDQLRKAGYQIQIKEVSGSHCSTMLLPAGNGALVGTNCWRNKGTSHIAVKVGATGQNDLLPMERVAALVDKAASRMPANEDIMGSGDERRSRYQYSRRP
jgi:hypothetical protein